VTVVMSSAAGNPPSACDRARDKAATRRLMAAAGLPSPKYTTIAGGTCHVICRICRSHPSFALKTGGLGTECCIMMLCNISQCNRTHTKFP
jgi:carbamoylphosphate synthase large subunit